MKKIISIVLFTLVLSLNSIHAQLLGGILCGIGVYCPPTVPTKPTEKESAFFLIENASIGKTLPDFYTYKDFQHLSQMLKFSIKTATPSFMIGWEKKIGHYQLVQSTFTLLKKGRRFDGYTNCMKYQHVITVRDTTIPVGQTGNIIAQENIIDHACAIFDDYTITGAGFMFYDVEERVIVYSK